jgi:hypothetical protein
MIAAKLVGYDEGRQTLGLYDTSGGTGWRLDLEALPLARDLQRLDDGILVGFDRGYFEVSAETGSVTKIVDRWTGVTSVRRAGDQTLVAGVDLAGRKGITVLSLDAADQIAAEAVAPGDYVRLFRTTPQGTWLLGSDDRFLETDTTLNEVRRLAAPGFRHAWMAYRKTGPTLVSAGYGAFMAWFDASGRLERTFGGVGEVPAEVEPFFYAMFEPLADGGILVANWQGHGPDNGAKGRQLIQFGPDGRYVDSCSLPGVSSLQGILVLN